MTVLPLLAVGLLMNLVAVLFILVSLFLILIVLMQKGRGGGLSGAFGGGMASGLLGSKTGDFLTWVTVVCVSIFLLLAVLMARYYRPSSRYGRDADDHAAAGTGRADARAAARRDSAGRNQRAAGAGSAVLRGTGSGPVSRRACQPAVHGSAQYERHEHPAGPRCRHRQEQWLRAGRDTATRFRRAWVAVETNRRTDQLRTQSNAQQHDRIR